MLLGRFFFFFFFSHKKDAKVAKYTQVTRPAEVVGCCDRVLAPEMQQMHQAFLCTKGDATEKSGSVEAEPTVVEVGWN